MGYRQNEDCDSEIVLGIVGPIGCNRELVIERVKILAAHYNYQFETIKVSKLIEKYRNISVDGKDQYSRITTLMDEGNSLRENHNDNSMLAKLSAIKISELRKKQSSKRVIYLIDSLKHPEEVKELRNIYGNGFYLFAIHAEEKERNKFLEINCNIKDESKREQLISRDKSEEDNGYGQSTSSAFHLADFFLSEQGDTQKLYNVIQRFLDLIFGSPFSTPTFQEYAMFMAHASGIRSADLSRQVGAVITRQQSIVSSGANECPKSFGGTYWPLFNTTTHKIYDQKDGRDYMRGADFNAQEKENIIELLKKDIPEEYQKKLEENINTAGLKDITEFGRVVHAEMDAILSCARLGVETKDSVMFCTTFPCHNCAKHIVASGINRVVYIEPYPKSKALVMHDDSITNSNREENEKVVFRPFIGVGPRQYINLFSMSLGDGREMKRKESDKVSARKWDKKTAFPRVKLVQKSYIDIEKELTEEYG